MPLETGLTISSLNKDWPLNTDQVLQGDDHLRLIKTVLLAQFPGDGGGLDNPLLANAEEFNFLQGVTANIQDQLDTALAIEEFPSGTIMTFLQASAPPGWTQVTVSVNDMLLRVTSGTGGGSGGNTLVTDLKDHTHPTADHQLDVSEMPSHGHSLVAGGDPVELNNGAGGVGNGLGGFDGGQNLINAQVSADTGGDGIHNHGTTEDSNNFDPAYLDIIICSKDV